MRPRTVLLLGLGALIPPLASLATTVLVGRPLLYPKEN